MNRIYQGKVSKAELLPLRLERGEGRGEVSKASPPPTDWNWESALWDHHALFQDAVNYYLVCLLALAAKGNDVYAIREKLDAKDEAGGDDELMIWRPFTRRGAKRRGLRDSVAPYLCPGKSDATPEDCFAAVLAGNDCAQSEEGRARLDAGLTQLLQNCKGESGCRDSAKEYLPRFCRTKTRCNYAESPIALRRNYQNELFPFALHSAATADAPELNSFNVFTIALPDHDEPRLVGTRAKEILEEMIADWRARLPAASADFDRLSKIVASLPATASVPGYEGASAKKEKRFRLYAMFFFRYLERSSFTLGLLQQTTPKPKETDQKPQPLPREVLMAGDPIQRSRGARGYVFRAFTSLSCWGGADAGEPQWLPFDQAALQEALKALNQVSAKREDRRQERERLVLRHRFMRGKLKKLPQSKGEDEQAETEPPVLAGDPRIEQLKKVVDVELRVEYEMSEGVSVRYGLHQRTLRGFHELRKKWNEILDKRKEAFEKRGINITPEAEFSESRRKRLLAKLRAYQKENPNIVGSVVLFEALLEKSNWIIWRQPTAKQCDEWSKKWRRAKDAAFAKDPLQALTDERGLIEDVRRLRQPIRVTPADPEHSRRQFYFYDGSHRPAKGRMPHDKQFLDAEIARCVNGNWQCDKVRIHYSAPRLLRDQINNTGGSKPKWQQAMMSALGLETGLLKGGLPKDFSECAAVALMPEAMPTPEQRAMLDRLVETNPKETQKQMALVKKRLLLNFPTDLDAVEIPRKFLELKGRKALFRTRTDPLTKQAIFDSYWEKQTVASYKKRKLDVMFHLRWPTTVGDAKRTEHGWWWEKDNSFSCLSVDLGQRDAGAFALLEATPGKAPKSQSRKLGVADGKTWWATVRATGMLRLPGEDALVMRDGKWQEEFSGERGRLASDAEWDEAQDICGKLGLKPNDILGTERQRYSFPEMNDRLLFALRKAQSRLARLQSWSCIESNEKRKEAIAKQLKTAVEELAEIKEGTQPDALLLELKPFVQKEAWTPISVRLIQEVTKERATIQRELVRIADRIQPLRGRRWEWALREDGKNYMLRQTLRGSDDRAKLLAGQRGLSMERIEQLESMRQRCQSLNRALRQEPGKPANLGKSKRGIELPDPCPELLDRLDDLKEQRVNQTAHMILAQALGVRLRAHADDAAARAARDIHGEYERIPGREPVDFLVLENLDRYLASQGRSRGENSKLMKWSHRAILGKLKQLCEPYGLRVLETPAAYSSRFCSLTGVAGFRAVELTPDNAKEFRWKKHLDRLSEANDGKRKLLPDERKESERVKRLFDALDDDEWNKAMQAEWEKARAEGRPFRPKWRTLLAPVAGGPIFIPASGMEWFDRQKRKTGKTERVFGYKKVGECRPVVAQADINAAINLGLRALAAPDTSDIHLRIRAKRDGETFVVRADNKREKARWGDKPAKVEVPEESERKKLLADAHLNFFADVGGVADYDHAEIGGEKGFASGRGIWGTIKGNDRHEGKDWQHVEEINRARIQKLKHDSEDNLA